MARLVAVLVGLVVVVVLFFPDQLHVIASYLRLFGDRLAQGAAGAYGGLAR